MQRFFIAVPMLLLASITVSAEPLPVSKEGKQLQAILDSMKVEEHWLAGQHITDWKTGKPDGKIGGPPTHCSLFASAVCTKLGVEMLNPPPQTFLSNRQQPWLQNEGKKVGWEEVKDGLQAQELANKGFLVLASYRNPNPKKAGHIAVIRPALIEPEAILKTGPRISQAGVTNYNNIDLKTGFRHHPGAWEKKEILFFAHPRPHLPE